MAETERRQELRRLLEVYAIRTRELSERISIFGRLIAAERQTDETLAQVKNANAALEVASQNLFAFIDGVDLQIKSAAAE